MGCMDMFILLMMLFLSWYVSCIFRVLCDQRKYLKIYTFVMIISIGIHCRNHIFRRFWPTTRACLVSSLDIPQEQPLFLRYHIRVNDSVLTDVVHSSASKSFTLLAQAVLDPSISSCISGVVLTSPAVGVQPSHPIYVVSETLFLLILFALDRSNIICTGQQSESAQNLIGEFALVSSCYCFLR